MTSGELSYLAPAAGAVDRSPVVAIDGINSDVLTEKKLDDSRVAITRRDV